MPNTENFLSSFVPSSTNISIQQEPVVKKNVINDNFLSDFKPVKSELSPKFKSIEGEFKLDSQYDKSMRQGMDLEENRAQQQTRLDRIGNAIPRLVSKVGTEVLKTPAYLYAVGEAGLTDKTLAESLDNSWLNTLQNLDDKTKEQFAIYTPESVKNGNLWDNVTSTSFWTNEGVDGAGYLLAYMAPGAAIKSIGLAAKVAKLGASANLAKNIELGTMTLMNTTLESAAEAKGLVDGLKPQLQLKVDNNEINNKTGKPWAQEDVTNTLGEVGQSSFLSNMALLAGPNFLMNKNLLGRFTPTKNTINKIVDETGKFIELNPLTKKQIAGQYAKEIGTGLFSEGFVEEAGQFAIEDYHKKLAKGETTDGLVAGILDSYGDALTSTEGQKSIFLGGLFGSTAALGGVKQLKAEQQYTSNLSKILKENFEGFSTDIDNIYQKDNKGQIVLDENNKPALDYKKAAQAVYNIALENKASQIKDVYALVGNKEAYDYISNSEFTRFAIPYLQEEGGLEVLNKHIDLLSNKMIEQKKLSENIDDTFNEGQYKSELRQKAQKLQKTYDSVDNLVKNIEISTTPELQLKVGEFLSKLKNSAFQEMSKQLYLSDRIDKLTNESLQLKIGSAAALPQVKFDALKIDNQIESHAKALKESIDNYELLFDIKEQRNAFNDYLKDDQIKDEVIKESSEKTPEIEKPVKTEQQEEFQPTPSIYQDKTDEELKPLYEQFKDKKTPEDELNLSEVEKEISNRRSKLLSQIKSAETEKDLDSYLAESDKKGYTDPEIIDSVSKRRLELEKTKTITIEDGIDESETVINKEYIDDDNTSRKKSDVFVTNGGTDNGKKESEERYFRTTESINLDGHKLLVVTKVSDPGLYQEILDNDPTAKAYEEKHKDYKGIWVILLDKDNNKVLVNGKFVQATLETAQRVSDNKIEVIRGYSKEEHAKVKLEAIRAINDLRFKIIGHPDGRYSGLKKGEIKHLNITGKSKGLLTETDVNANVIHTAFEFKEGGKRKSNNVIGRLVDSLKQVKLVLPVIKGYIHNGAKLDSGKLYIEGENGRLFDLIPRNINPEEVKLILLLIENKLSGKDSETGANSVNEIKKIISFKQSSTAPEFQIYINKDNRLVFGSQEVEYKDLQPTEQGESQRLIELINFLETKRVNVNNKYILAGKINTPSINGDIGKSVNYKDYLLSNENGIGGTEPMFGTDVKEKFNSEGKPNKRFIQTYFIYDSNLVDGKSDIVNKDVNKESEIIEDNTKPIIEDTKVEDKKRTYKKKSPEELTRLREYVKDKTRLTQAERDWFKLKLPNISIDALSKILSEKQFGQFISSGQVLLSDDVVVGTLHHEAFHVVTQLYLTKNEVDKLYRETGEKYPGKSRQELEEILAEDFVNYKKNGEVLGKAPIRNTLFRKLINMLRDAIGMSASDIKDVYRRLDKGYYSNATVIGLREFSSLNSNKDLKKITKKKGSKFVKDILDGLDSIYMDKLYDGGKTAIAIVSNSEEVIDVIYKDFVNKYESEKEINIGLIEDYEYILDNWDSIIKIWSKRLSTNGIELKITDSSEQVKSEEGTTGEDYSTNEEENNNQRAGDAYQEGNLTSTLSYVASPVRMLLRSLKKVNKDGTKLLNDLNLTVPVDFSSTYAYLLKNTVGTGSSYSDLYNKIEELIQFKPEFQELLDRLGKPSSEISEDDFNFQTQFLQDFNKNRTNSLITIYEADGNIRIVDANRQNEADKVKTIWEANLTKYTKQSKEGNLMIDLSILDIKDNIKFLEKLGVKFDDNTLTYIDSNKFDSSELNKSVAAFREYIRFHEGNVTNLFNQVKGKQTPEEMKVSVVGGRLNYLLNLEAQYTSIVNELSFISADNKTEYSVGENNGLSITTNIINNSKSKEDLFSKLSHLNTVGIEGSLWLNELFDETTGLRNEGIKIELELHNGIRTATEVENQVKQPTRKGTKGDLFTQQTASILNGKSNYIVSADKSQEFIISLNYYGGNKRLPISIEELKDSFNNPKLKQIFRNYFKSEFNKIARFELDGLGKNVDNYNNNGGKWTVFQDILAKRNKGDVDIKATIKDKLKELSDKEITFNTFYNEILPETGKTAYNSLMDDILQHVDKNVIDFFNSYKNELETAFKFNGISKQGGFPKELSDKYSVDQLIRTVAVTDLINSIEQTKVFIGDLAFYKDLYKRTSMMAGTKQLPRVDSEMDQHLNKFHARKDGKLADGKENTIVSGDVTTEKQDIADWVSEYMKSTADGGQGLTEEKAKEVLGWSYDDKTKEYKPSSAYSSADEGDAMGWGSMDFIKEFHKRIGTWTPKMEIAYKIIQEQEFNDEGDLIKGKLLDRNQIALFQTLKLQYAGPIEHSSTIGLFVPGGYKYTVMPLIPQMIAGKNLSKLLKNMQDKQAGISLFKSASKFGTILREDGKPNKFYTNSNNGEINSDVETQSISYQYLGLQVKPSSPHDEYIFSTQLRKTAFINAFSNGKENFVGAKKLIDDFNSLLDERTKVAKDELIKELGVDPVNYTAQDVSKIVELLTKAAEDRKLTNNIIDSLDVEIINGKKLLKYNIDSMVNKPKIDSMLMAIVNSRLIKQKYNGDAYVLATVAGMEKLGNREIGTNKALRGYTKDKTTGKTLPAEVMIAMSKNYSPLLKKYKTLKGVNEAIKAGLIDNEVLELIACRIPGQGMNSNEYLTIKEFLPEDSATTMIAHPDIIAKAGSDFDNDKLYTYRQNLNENGDYIEDNLDNKILKVLKDVISHEFNFLPLITPNSTSIISPIVDEIKYTKYKNDKIAEGKEPLSKELYIKLTTESAKNNIKYTELIKFHKKVNARYKLWLAKDEVGMSAIANAYGPLSQIGGITANKTYIDDKTGEKVIVNINLPHNEIEDKLNLGAQKDSEGKNYISEINNQLINIIVDAAKDEEPMVSHLNMTKETLPIYLYLNRLGVPFEIVANFMVQPVISEYIEMNGVNKSVFLKATKQNKTKIIQLVSKGFSKDLTKEEISGYKDVEITIELLKKYQLTENQNGSDYKLFQLQVLRDFSEYKTQSQLFGNAVRVTNSDSAGLGQNINASRLKLIDNQKVFKAKFINRLDKIIENTFIKSFQQDDFVIKTYYQFYDSQKPEIIDNIIKFADRIESEEGGFMTKNDKLKLINTIENDFIDFVVQNYGYKNVKSIKDRLFKGENSVAKQLLDLKNKPVEELTEDEKKIVDNLLIKELFPLIDKAAKGFDNIKIYSKRLDTFTSDQLTEAFRELKDNNLKLGVKLMHVGILQSGLNNSPITYLGIVPFEYYNQLVKDSFKEFNKTDIVDQMGKFNILFQKNKTGELGYKMYGKDYSLDNISKKEEKEKTDSFINHSGGAIGSDTIWGTEGEKFGVISNHYWMNNKTPNGNKEISDQDRIEGQQKVTIAARQMGRIEKTHQVKDERLIRNWSQVKYADEIFAISTMLQKGSEMNYGKKALIEQGKGGTGYAIQMAINEGKVVYMFDQIRNQWYSNKDGVWSKSEIPVLTKNFAGIGTREINESGKQAIRDVYQKTFNNLKDYTENLQKSEESGSFVEDKKPVPVLVKEETLKDAIKKSDYITQTHGDLFIKQHFYVEGLKFLQPFIKDGSVKVSEVKNKLGSKGQKIFKVDILKENNKSLDNMPYVEKYKQEFNDTKQYIIDIFEGEERDNYLQELGEVDSDKKMGILKNKIC